MEVTKLASKIINLSGENNNISQVTHCMTRLRIRVKDDQLFKGEEIKNLEGVLNIVKQGGEFQIVIGPKVSKLYQETVLQLGLEERLYTDESSDNKIISKGSTIVDKIKTGFEQLMDIVSSVFVPIIGIIAAGGTLRGLLAIATQFQLLSKESSTYVLLHALGNAVFYFFPILLGYTAVKKFKGNPYFGALLGAAIIYPSVISLAGEAVTLFGFRVNVLNYSNSVLPIIFGAWVLVKIQKITEKYLPSVMQIVFVPLISLLLSYILILIVIGPIVTNLNTVLTSSVMFLYNTSPILAGAVLGFLWQASILAGVGWGFVPIFLGNYVTLGFDPLMALCTPSLFAQTGAAFAAGMRAKNTKYGSIGISAAISCLLGVTEPAIYGINFPAKKPFFIALIGGGIGGVLAALVGAKQYAIGPSGVFLYPVYINPENGMDSAFFGLVIATLVAFIFSFVVTYFFGYKNTILDSSINQEG